MSSGYLYYYIFLFVICLPTPPILSISQLLVFSLASSPTQLPAFHYLSLPMLIYPLLPKGQHEPSACSRMHLSSHTPGVFYAQAQLKPQGQSRSESAHEALPTLILSLPFCSICLVHMIWHLAVCSHCFIHANALSSKTLWSFWAGA